MGQWLKTQILKKTDAEIQVNRKKFLMKIFLQIPHIYLYTAYLWSQFHTDLISAVGTTMYPPG